jgi:hypothetical protein
MTGSPWPPSTQTHEIAALTTERNIRSRRVMDCIGMTRDARRVFERPSVPLGDSLRPHKLNRQRPNPGRARPEELSKRPDEMRTS